MKSTKIIYWTSTVLVALMNTYAAYAYLTQEKMVTGFQHLGYPSYFRVELALAKVIGVLLLVLPIGARFKEWAYIGFAITFVSAFIAHVSSGDPASMFTAPLISLVVLGVSYFSFHKLQSVPSVANA